MEFAGKEPTEKEPAPAVPAPAPGLPGRAAEPPTVAFRSRRGAPPAGYFEPSVIQRACAACAVEEEDEILRAPDGSGGGVPGGVPAAVREVAATPGRPLDPGTRRSFEGYFARDFGAVRVHDDATAARAARAIHAHAYTSGDHIVFAEGRYSPGAPEGRALLAHELTHVAQQASGAAAEPGIGAPDSPQEREAERAAAAVRALEPTREAPSPGAPLPSHIRRDAEGLLRRDFAHVRVHHDGAADATVRALDARAVTRGSDVYFRAGAFSPDTGAGRRTLLHELVHVAQADTHVPAEGRSRPTDRSEAQADALAELAATGVPVPAGWNPANGAEIQAEPWFRGVADGAPPVSHGAVIHDLGDGVYFSDSAEVARQYSTMRGRATGTPARVLAGDIPTSDLGRVLDLTADARWHEYLTNNFRNAEGQPIDLRPLLRSGEPYWNIFRGFLQKHGLNLADYDAIVGPEAIRGGRQLCIRTPSIAQAVQAAMHEIVPPVPVEGTRAGAPGEGGVRPAPLESRVATNFRVTSARAGEGGTTVAEVEVTLGEGLDAVNSGLPEGTPRVPSRMVLRVTVDPQGAFVAAEAVEGPAALAEGLGRQVVSAVARAAPEGGAVAGAVSPWIGRIAIAGWVVFAVVTTYQLATATPEQRPRVATQAAGGLLTGMAGAYLVCNLALDLETAGWGILICGFLVGGATGYAGSHAAGAAYDAATADPVVAALRRLESAPEQTRRLFYAMLASRAGTAGLPVTADFVDRFVALVPADLSGVERIVLEAQLRAVGPGDTLATVLTSLDTAIRALPGRGPATPGAPAPAPSPPPAPTMLLQQNLYRDRPSLLPTLVPLGPNIQLFPPPLAPLPGAPPAPTGTLPLLQISL